MPGRRVDQVVQDVVAEVHLPLGVAQRRPEDEGPRLGEAEFIQLVEEGAKLLDLSDGLPFRMRDHRDVGCLESAAQRAFEARQRQGQGRVDIALPERLEGAGETAHPSLRSMLRAGEERHEVLRRRAEPVADSVQLGFDDQTVHVEGENVLAKEEALSSGTVAPDGARHDGAVGVDVHRRRGQ